MNPVDFAGALGSLKQYLNSEIFTHPGTPEMLRRGLQEGRLVAIRNAFKESFAERMFRCLDQSSDWKVYEAYKDLFHYHHHNLYDDHLFPPDLNWCRGIFDHPETKEWIQEFSGRDCTGKLLFSASYYLPGDHSLPHNDLVSLGEHQWRQVAFVWHLAKNWQPSWGGHFYWCPRNRYLTPAFNTLLLFNVGPNSRHFVTVVSPYAQSKRLALNGWWTGKTSCDLTPPDDAENVEPPLLEII